MGNTAFYRQSADKVKNNEWLGNSQSAFAMFWLAVRVVADKIFCTVTAMTAVNTSEQITGQGKTGKC